MIQKSISLKYELSSEPLHISAKQLFLNQNMLLLNREDYGQVHSGPEGPPPEKSLYYLNQESTVT